MDTRLYILAGALLLLFLFIGTLYVVATRGASRRAPQAAPPSTVYGARSGVREPPPGPAEPVLSTDVVSAPETVPRTLEDVWPDLFEKPVPALRPTGDAPLSPDRKDSADYVMAAPVEVWVGEIRIEVMPGTGAFDEFQRCADVLLDEVMRAAKRA